MKMKIELEKHNPLWKGLFENIKTELIEKIGFLHPRIEHIGSTSIEGLSAKPIIDILIGLEHSELLQEVINPLLEINYVYYPIYNEIMPYRRFFIKYKSEAYQLKILNIVNNEQDVPKSTEEHNLRLAHIHILTYESEHWIRHIAFRDYLKEHISVQKQYQELKENLSTKNWSDGNDYNRAKNDFIKTEEKKAINWYVKRMNR